MPVMVAFGLLLVPLVRSDGRLSRGDGLVLCAVYLGYLLLIARTGP